MITLFRTKFKIRILYKSGNSQEFWVTQFTIHNGTYTCRSIGKVHPLDMAAEYIEAVYQIDQRTNWLRYIGLARGKI